MITLKIKLRIVTTLLFLIFSVNIFSSELSELLSKIANSPERQADFIETRTAFFLESPLITKGILKFKTPTTLIKIITFPEKSVQRIEDDILSVISNQDKENIKIISLSSQPELEIGINAIRWVLSGNYELLNKSFKITYKKNKRINKPNWLITLVPKDSKLRETINTVLISGEKTHISQIDIIQLNGVSIKTELYER